MCRTEGNRSSPGTCMLSFLLYVYRFMWARVSQRSTLFVVAQDLYPPCFLRDPSWISHLGFTRLSLPPQHWDNKSVHRAWLFKYKYQGSNSGPHVCQGLYQLSRLPVSMSFSHSFLEPPKARDLEGETLEGHSEKDLGS